MEEVKYLLIITFMKIHSSKYMLVSAMIFSSVLLAGCSFHGDIEGPNSYSIQCDKGRDCIVLDEANHVVVIEPEVDKYAISDEYLIGHTLHPKSNPIAGVPEPFHSQKPGYFIVNTKNGNSQVGLSEKSWRQRLLKLGIKDLQLSDSWFEHSE